MVPENLDGLFLLSKTFWDGVLERAIKTFAQALLAVLTAGNAIWGLDWTQALGVGATAALISVLTSIADPKRADTSISTGKVGDRSV